jgi:long-chain acyl-CoA synthetase
VLSSPKVRSSRDAAKEGPLLSGFARLLAERAESPAIFALSERRVVRFRDLEEECDEIEACLARTPVPRGRALLSLAGNRASWFALFLAGIRRENVLLSLDSQTSSVEAASLAERYGVSAIVAPSSRLDLNDVGARPGEDLPGGLRLWVVDRSEPRLFPGAFLLKLTSGSVGTPRAVLVSEENLWNDGRHVVEAMGIGKSDVNYGVIPLSHSYGIGNLVAPLFLQGNPVALRDLFLPGQLFEDAQATSLSTFPGVPFLFDQILPLLKERGVPKTLRLFVSAGARIEESLVTQYKHELGVKIHSFYGTSETGGITYDDSDDLSEPLNVGRPMPETEVTLTNDRSLASSGRRVRVRGNAIAKGYVESEGDDDASRFENGAFLTGDVGHFNESGRLVLTGRVSSFVNVAGRKVDPGEAESVLLAMPDVAAAKVIGLPCDRRGQKLVAFVVPLSRELSLTRVRSYCAEKLSPHKIPRDVILLDSLPLTPRGKVDRAALEELSRATDSEV